ncbi:P-loop containing nucleoside triphosphate hydrolases superfamily protein [Hibiscus syriacus]|uniref:P-loop containing nucleoside triphosphate hydrolases superfamily protein n=1 Tax=Hibiscus syriacus TaxID=106335 RepID=A0A6A2WKG9_HIBSY|nr:P-loop containing nucleoside triphosphate hydrolases superfamily protein [Hibiscus syriacus]
MGVIYKHSNEVIKRCIRFEKWKASNARNLCCSQLSNVCTGVSWKGSIVYPLANFMNCTKIQDCSNIEFPQQFVMWWAGLMRGAVTIALSYNQFFSNSENENTEDSALMITCTMILVMFSTVLMGSITKPLIEALALLRHARQNVSDATDISSLEDLRILLIESGAPSDMLENQLAAASRRSSTVHHLWRKFDDRFMRPVFGGRESVPFVPGSPTGAADETSGT